VGLDVGDSTVDKLVAAIHSKLADPTDRVGPLLVAIDGLGGAGKSTFADDLARCLQARKISVQVVHMDDFYLPSAQRPDHSVQTGQVGGDFDWQRLRDQVLIPLTHGQRAAYQRYDWGTDALGEWIALAGHQVVIVEGVTALRHELRDHYHLTVWIDCPRPTRLARGIARDGEDARQRWEEEWMPEEDRYYASHLPHLAAEWVYAGTGLPGPTYAWRSLGPR
jgi:uridine kinase